MKNYRTAHLALFVALGLLVGAHDLAAQGTYVHRYQFLPEASSLTIAGGFGGFDLEYGIRGTFGLVIHQDPAGPTTFGFTQVRAKLVGDPLFNGASLDQLIGMSNWTGTLSNSYLIDFKGFDGQEAPMHATGTLGNVMFWLEGTNRPPCCDYFDFRLDAMAQFVSIVRSNTDVDLNSQGRDGSMDAPITSQVPEPQSAMLAICALLAFRVRRLAR